MSEPAPVTRPTPEDFIWAAIMLAPTAAVCTSILAGEPVRVGDLNPNRLYQALRGELRLVDEYILITQPMLLAILEAGHDRYTKPLEPNLRGLPYVDYLRTPHWRSIRRDALRRADGRCQLCNSPPHRHQPLNVHHRTYERRGAERPEDVIVLCRACHERHHSPTPPRLKPPKISTPR